MVPTHISTVTNSKVIVKNIIYNPDLKRNCDINKIRQGRITDMNVAIGGFVIYTHLRGPSGPSRRQTVVAYTV